MEAIRLKTEYLTNPLGIDMKMPRLFWNCQSGLTQTAYRIIAETDGKTVWDSGKVLSRQMAGIPYPQPLVSRQRVDWRVRLWDENDHPGEWSKTAFFEMGFLDSSDWRGKWITGNYRVDKKRRYPVDCFRRYVEISKDVRRARLYITACGLYEARVDGKKVGGFCLAPGHTDYRKRIQYQTYDVTDLLTPGRHRAEIQLADGWYRGSCGAWGLKNQYGTETKLLAQIEIFYEDGCKDTLVTGSTWDWSNDGPIRFADNKDGEIVEAFRIPSYGGKAKVTSCDVIPCASNNVPVTEHECFHPVITKAPDGKLLLDFGQNIAGYAAFSFNAEEGQQLTLRFGEMLDEAGNLTLKNIQCSNKKVTTPLQEIDYICKAGRNDYRTTFAVFGFRYAEADTELELSPEDVTAVAVYSDMAQTGFFESSNDLLNRFVDCTVWSAKGNSLDVPTDCPTRERHGWSGDAQIFFNTAGYLLDYAAFARKYVRDLYDWQRPNGCLPQIAPSGGVDSYMNAMNGSVGWADAGVLIPYRFWKLFGDDSLIREHWESMAGYAKFMIDRCGKWTPLRHSLRLKGDAKRYIVNFGQSYGEWAEPADVYPNHWTNMVLPHPEESTAYTAYVMGCMTEIAAHLGKSEEQAVYAQYRDGCTAAYQELVRLLPEHSLDTNRQAKLVRPLYMKLLDQKQTDFARKRLHAAMEHYGWRLGTGFLSTPFILDVLAETDIESAYRLLENEEMPGWLFMPKNGATTIWESWEGTQAQGGIASLNHYSKGALCEWLFGTMCGIRVEGENHFAIAPRPGGHFSCAKAVYDSVYGRVESGWKRTKEGTEFYVSIPAGCTARVCLPDGRGVDQCTGEQNYFIPEGA